MPIHKQSKRCQHHKVSGREPSTYACSAVCQAVHKRCKRCSALGGGEHATVIIDGLCFDARYPRWSCLSTTQTIYEVVCVMCGHDATYINKTPSRCEREGCNGLLEVVQRIGPKARPTPRDNACTARESPSAAKGWVGPVLAPSDSPR